MPITIRKFKILSNSNGKLCSDNTPYSTQNNASVQRKNKTVVSTFETDGIDGLCCCFNYRSEPYENA